MIIQSTRPVTSIVQNKRNIEALAEGNTVTLDAAADVDAEAQAVFENYQELDDAQKEFARKVVEKTDFKLDEKESSEFVTAFMSGLGGAGIAAVSGRSDLVSLVGGFAVGAAAGWGGHKVGTAVWSKIDTVELEVFVESKNGGLPSVKGTMKASS